MRNPSTWFLVWQDCGELPSVVPDGLAGTKLWLAHGGMRVFGDDGLADTIRLWQDDTHAVLMEGRIYGPTGGELSLELLRLAHALNTDSAETRTRTFVRATDGEYNIVLLDKISGAWALFNDSLGRLPMYHASRTGMLCIGRSAVAVGRNTGHTTFDPLRLTCRLLFGYPFDAGTEIAGVRNLSEGSLVQCDGTASPRIVALEPLDLDRLVPTGVTAKALADLLVAGCERRCRGDLRPLLSLSGGLDSRVVAAALQHSGADWMAVTRAGRTADSEDVALARQVATILKCQHRIFTISDLDLDTVCLTSRRSDGALSIELSHMLCFLREVHAALGPDFLLLTGDGGDKTLASLAPHAKLNTPKDVTAFLEAMPDQREYELCARLTGVDRRLVRDYLAACVEDAPERTALAKYKGITLRQRGRRWIFQGEDRNRLCFWSTSPFWAPDFFRASLAMTDAAKDGGRLHHEVLGVMNTACAVLHRQGYDTRNPVHSLIIKAYATVERSPRFLNAYRLAKRFVTSSRRTNLAVGVQAEAINRFVRPDHLLFETMGPKRSQAWLRDAYGSTSLSRFISLAIAHSVDSLTF